MCGVSGVGCRVRGLVSGVRGTVLGVLFDVSVFDAFDFKLFRLFKMDKVFLHSKKSCSIFLS